MQTLSSMQRNRFNFRFIKDTFSILMLFCYEIATMVSGVLPPLFGLFFAYVTILEYEKHEKHIAFGASWYVAVAFLLCAEQFHGYALFSVALSFFIFYFFIFDYLLENIKFRNLLLVVIVCVAYLLIIAFNNLFCYILQQDSVSIGYEYLIFMSVESALALLLFRGRIL
ncbi:MAG: hypothetical protein ACTTIM_02315 [Campylobacter sp.]